jgi:hypothetical protein
VGKHLLGGMGCGGGEYLIINCQLLIVNESGVVRLGNLGDGIGLNWIVKEQKI